MEWRDTTIITKFKVIIFVHLGQWNFSLLNCKKVFRALESGISKFEQYGSIFRTQKMSLSKFEFSIFCNVHRYQSFCLEL